MNIKIYNTYLSCLELRLFIPERDYVLSCSPRLLKEILYNLSSGSLIIETTYPPAFVLRFIFFSVCTDLCRPSVLSKIMYLMTSKLTRCEVL